MRSSEMGTAILKDKQGNRVQLCNTLYVPGLGANLLSGRKMCDSGLQGGFDMYSLWFKDNTGKIVIRAVESGGVYQVDSVSPQIHDLAFHSVQIPVKIQAFDA